MQKPIVERAFEIARAGACLNAGDVRQQLALEGYGNLASWFASDHLKQSLAKACRSARSCAAER